MHLLEVEHESPKLKARLTKTRAHCGRGVTRDARILVLGPIEHPLTHKFVIRTDHPVELFDALDLPEIPFPVVLKLFVTLPVAGAGKYCFGENC